jgi:CubicO group peptidase (beta-lactamase class C family)
LTKTFTAAAIGELVAEGKLDWDTTPVNKYLPDFQLKDPSLTSQITFTDLLAQYSVSSLTPPSLPLFQSLKHCHF